MSAESQIAILVPTLGRADRLANVAENIHKNTQTVHTIYFLIEKEDTASLNAIQKIGEKYILNEAIQYVGAINTGFKRTTEPFIFCGSDDLDFKRGWDIACLKVMEYPKVGITGGTDSWTISKTGLHVSHLFIRREYIEKYGGVEDEKNTIYSSRYIHTMCDIETEQTAMKRGAFKICPDAVIEHNHWFMGTAEKDSTYDLCQSSSDHDHEVYVERRKRFEQYYFERLFHGQVYRVNQGKLSIVLPVYNQLQYTKMTLESLKENTYHDYELIIVDDNSDYPTKSFINQISRQCKKLTNNKQEYVTAAWNKGLSHATGDYIAVINNDITLSKHWDIYLMNELDKKDVWMANPYQTDEGMMEPYGKHERAGGIDIRGTCFMFKKETLKTLGPIPSDLKMWFNDFWLAWQVTEVNKKKSVFVPEAVVHHYGSKSSEELDLKTKMLWWIIRGDAYAFTNMTGIDTRHWIEIAEAHL
jgi:GT2 family glycosyltransferase